MYFYHSWNVSDKLYLARFSVSVTFWGNEGWDGTDRQNDVGTDRFFNENIISEVNPHSIDKLAHANTSKIPTFR